MKVNIFKILKEKNAAALPMVMMIFVVLMILIASIITIFTSNLRQVKYQEEMIEAHYIALSGIDLAVASLLQEGIGGPTDTLLSNEFHDTIPIANTPTLTDTISLNNGEVSITIRAIDDTERWVEVRAVGALTGSSATRTIRLTFLVQNPAMQNWDTE